jgi:hypothetical protein
MQVQGAEIINTAWFDAIVEKINAARNSLDLQEYASEALEPVSAQITVAEQKLAQLSPYLALLTMPTPTPQAIISWLTSLVAAQVQPQVQAYYTYVQQLATIEAQISRVQSAISAAEQRIKAAVRVPAIPTIPTLPTLPPLPGGGA